MTHVNGGEAQPSNETKAGLVQMAMAFRYGWISKALLIKVGALSKIKTSWSFAVN